MSCAGGRKKQDGVTVPFDLQGHRGCRGLLPENTIPAMLRAIDLGVTTLEMDVVITKDSVCVLSHEPFFHHEISTKPDGKPVEEAEERSLNIFNMTLQEVQEFDVGMRKHPRFPYQQPMPAVKPTLQQVFAAVADHCQITGKQIPFFNIETKSTELGDRIFHPEPETFVRRLMATINAANMRSKTIVQSFDFRTLQQMHEKYPDVAVAALIEDFDSETLAIQLKKLGFIPNIYSPHFSLVTPLMVSQCRELGMKLIPWTVNDLDNANKLRSLGVNGLITDYPDRIK
jgi:glycerophosphoryl diester phosphodiesterase